MIGAGIHDFSPLPGLSLEELVPKDNFYRRLEERLALLLAVRLAATTSGNHSGFREE